MAIPDYETVMLPLMQLASDGNPHSIEELSKQLSDQFKLTPDEREQRIPSGQSTYIKNRTGWARTYLKKAGLLLSPKRGFVQITDRGREVLSTKPERINKSLLEQFAEFRDFQQKTSPQTSHEVHVPATSDTETPEETIDRSYSELRSQLADELL